MPAFTSAAAATTAAGQPVDLTFTTAGSPTGFVTNITRNGALPAGLTFTSKGNGTATLTGMPSGSSGGSYPLTLSAQTAGGVTTQAFVLTVTAAPAISPGQAPPPRSAPGSTSPSGPRGAGPHAGRDRVPSAGTVLDRQRRRHGHPGRRAGGGAGRRLQADVHRLPV